MQGQPHHHQAHCRHPHDQPQCHHHARPGQDHGAEGNPEGATQKAASASGPATTTRCWECPWLATTASSTRPPSPGNSRTPPCSDLRLPWSRVRQQQGQDALLPLVVQDGGAQGAGEGEDLKNSHVRPLFGLTNKSNPLGAIVLYTLA